MKILVVHNFYQQPGGEDTVVERETALLRQAGHTVTSYYRSNQEVEALNWSGKLLLPKRMIWASDAVRDLKKLIRTVQPDLVHFHNTHFMISPAAYGACRDTHTPVVQTLHNPRLMCPAASFYRAGQVCQDCLGKPLAWPGILHGCYRQSRLQTAVLAFSLYFHRNTWTQQIDAYITMTEFYRRLYIAGGLPAHKLHVKPHFVMPVPDPRAAGPGGYALFVGRFDPEKGTRTLLRAWEGLDVPLKIGGDGPLLAEVRQAAESKAAIELVGRLPREKLFEVMRGARFLVWPSYAETFGLVAIESFACGVPVIASRIGVLAEIVTDGQTGLHFAPGDARDLAAKVRWAWEHPNEMLRYGQNARRAFEQHYTPARNYELLMAIYEKVIS